MLYMVRAGYDPQGMVDLQRLLVRISGANPSLIERMFSTHPMSSERLQTATERARTVYAGRNKGALGEAAYLAATADIRKIKGALKQFATAETQIARKAYAAAKMSAERGLALAPRDYVGLMLLARASQAGGDTAAARQAAARALQANPGGARAQSMLAQCALQRRDYAAALRHLDAFERQVPGVAATAFHKGLAYDGQGQKNKAVQSYRAYVARGGTSTAEGRFASQRLQQLAPAPAPATR